MKQKQVKTHLLISAIVLTLIMSPILVLAADCSDQIISGGATSHGGSHATGNNCKAEYGSCITGANPDGNLIVGLRVQIYHYDTSRGADGITLLGSGVDIWTGNNINKLKASNSRFSIPTTSNLKIKASCDEAKTDGSNAYGRDLTQIYPLNLETYLSGETTTSNKKWEVVWDTGMKSYFPENMDHYILTYDASGNPVSGWLNENILVKLKNNTPTDNTFIKDLFHMSDSEFNILKSNTSDIYVTFEMLYRFYIPKGSVYTNKKFNAEGDYLYFGTVSEAGIVHGWSNIYNALMSSDGNVGNLVSPNIKGTYLIKQVSDTLPNKKGYNNNTTANLKVVCREARGYAVYNIANICKECGPKTCEESCKNYTNGTVGRRECAVKYCTENEVNNKDSCISACYQPKTCETECGIYEVGTSKRMTCATNYCNLNESSNRINCINSCSYPDIDWGKGCGTSSTTCGLVNGKNSKNCVTDGSGMETKTNNVCYDDTDDIETKYQIGGKDVNISYYKVECVETLKIFSQPESTKSIKISENRLASLYVGIGTTYNKTCSLLYRDIYGNWMEDDGETEYENSEMKIKNDIAKYKDYMESSSISEALKKDYENAISKLNDKYEESKRFFEDKSKKDKVNDAQSDEIKIDIDIFDAGTTRFKKEEITMIPTSCKKGTFENYQFCTMEKAKWSKLTTADCEANIDLKTVNGKNVFEYTTFYSLPSSWVVSMADNETQVFRDAASCISSVKDSNGKCIEKQNVWVFDPFTKDVIREVESSTTTEGKYTISFLNFGSCGNIKYDYNCEYNIHTKNKCSACLNEIYGTAEYEKCYKDNCSCDAYCGSNVSCRAMYCPEECPECLDGGTDDCGCYIEKCAGKYTDEDDKLICRYGDCCSAKCETEECEINCCVKGCEAKYSGDNNKIDSCIKLYCKPLPPPGEPGGGKNYVYRTISMSNPFPEREPGQNWSTRVPYITESTDSESRYYDETNGNSDNFEYQFVLSGDDIKEIKKKYNNPYVEYNKSNIKSSKSKDAYCSAMLYGRKDGNDVVIEGILDNIITEYTINSEAGSGCVR